MLPIVKSLRADTNGTISCGVRRGKVTHSGWLLTATLLLVLALAFRVNAQAQNTCPPGLNDTPALSTHLDQDDIASGKLTFKQIFRFGQQLFITNFNKCDGAGRPGNAAQAGLHGVGSPRTPDPFSGPRFTMLSGPDANSCASCHNEPGVGGTASFAGNLREQAVDCNPVVAVFFSSSLFGMPDASRPCRPTTPTSTNGGFSNLFNERGSLGFLGSGAIELLGREMTDDLQNLQAQAIAQARAAGHDVTVELETKGVQFGTLTAFPDGTVDTSGVQGVSPDLVIRPFGRKGQNKSLRHFSIQAFNRHHGMQPVEALEQLDPPFSDSDPDQDGVSDELTVGDITAVMVFLAGCRSLRGLTCRSPRNERRHAASNCFRRLVVQGVTSRHSRSTTRNFVSPIQETTMVTSETRASNSALTCRGPVGCAGTWCLLLPISNATRFVIPQETTTRKRTISAMMCQLHKLRLRIRRGQETAALRTARPIINSSRPSYGMLAIPVLGVIAMISTRYTKRSLPTGARHPTKWPRLRRFPMLTSLRW